MRILIIQPWIKQGGAEEASLYLAYHLSKMGHQAKIAALFADLKDMPPSASQVEYLLPNKKLTIAEGGIRPWSRISGNGQMIQLKLLAVLAGKYKFNINTFLTQFAQLLRCQISCCT